MQTLVGRLSGGLSSNFWRLWSATLAGNLADGVFGIVMPLLAVRLTDSPLLVAGVAVAGRVPSLALVLVAGALADRLDRRRLMAAVQLLRIIVVGTLAVVALLDLLSLPVLYIAAFVLGLGETFFDTSAQSLLPSVVSKGQLPTANGRLFAAETGAESFAGPPLGGLLIAVAVPLALAASALGFVLALLGLLLLRGDFRVEHVGTRPRLHTDIAEGLHYLVHHRLLLTLSAMVAVGRFASSAFFGVFVLYAVAPGPMRLNEPEFGLLFTTFAAGSLIGSVLVGPVTARVDRARILIGSMLVWGLSFLIPALTTNSLVVGTGFFIGGVATMLWNVTNVSLRQRLLPSNLLGRVHASHRLFASVAGIAGGVVGGLVAEVAGIRAVFIVAAAAGALTALGAFIVTDEAIERAEAAVPVNGPHS